MARPLGGRRRAEATALPGWDGELCGVRPDGTTSFSLIQNASDTGNSGALVFFLFDIQDRPAAPGAL